VVSSVLGRLARYLPSVLSGVVIVIAGVVVGNLARHAAGSAARAARLGYSRALGEIARFSVLAVAGVMALEQFGINSTVLVVAFGLAIGGGIGGLALAFGLGSRDAVSNLVAGRHVSRTYRAGQRVRVGDVEGRIIQLEGSSVTLDTGEGRTMVPAKLFAETPSVLLDEEA
jgi:small-conductance mechanosensitive channel